MTVARLRARDLDQRIKAHTMQSIRQMTSLGLSALLLIACAKKDKTIPESPQAAATAADAPAQQRKPSRACAMVTPAEMSTIVGSSVVAEPRETGSNETGCIYKSASPHSPYVELTLNRGDGEGAMTAQAMLGQSQAGLTHAYPGIGDQAYAVGPELMIRNGDDLVTLLVLGVTDAPATVKRIFDTAKPRM
jgi:hypothetical protein